jgi:hypothetical protein
MPTVTLAVIASDILASGVRLGEYQRGLLKVLAEDRLPCWSGANLKGKARGWASYNRSRNRVVALLRAEARRRNAGQVVRYADKADHGRIVVELVA